MSASDAINNEQHLNSSHIKQLTTHKDVRELLHSLIGNDIKFIASNRGKHIQLKAVGNGLTHVPKTPSDPRSIANVRSQIQREIRKDLDPNWSFPVNRPQKKKNKNQPDEPQDNLE